MKLRTTTLLFALLLIPALFSGGCVWGKRSALAILAGAREDALETSTVHFTMETSFEGLDADSEAADFSFKAHGATDSKNKKSFFVMESSGIEIESRVLDGKIYTRLFGDTWTEMDAGNQDLGLFDGSFNPFDLLENWGVDDSDVKHIGSGELHGKHAERYSVTLDPEDMDSDLTDLMPPGVKPEVEIWIDSDGMPARLSYKFTIEPGADLGLDNTGTVTFSLVLDLFDYGKPVDVEAPPADKITDDPDFGSLFGGAAADPFEGADCYGDRLEDCLQPDPKTDAMASNPDLCRTTTARICLVPVGKVRPDVVKAIVDFHKETKGLDVVVLPGIPLMMSDLRVADSQVTDLTVYKKMQTTYGVSDSSASTFIAITPIDIVPDDDKFGWEFGSRRGSGPYGNLHGVFSYFRMVNVAPYNGKPITDDLIHERVAKYAARYTAILYLHTGTSDNIQYLNYEEMYGFSDLDSMGTKWPEQTAPECTKDHEGICLIPDGDYADAAFLTDLQTVADRLVAQGLPVAIFKPSGVKFVPSKNGWGVEFSEDLTGYYRAFWEPTPSVTIIGVSDDTFAQDPSVITPHFEYYRAPAQVGVVSTFDPSSQAGTTVRQERLYRMVLRALLQVHYHMPLSEDEQSLMWKGARVPSDLDGKTIPPIPR